MDGLVLAYADLQLSVYIDDFAFAAEGSEEEVVHILGPAAQDLERVLEDELKCGLAEDKVALHASSPRLARRLRRLLGKLAGEDKQDGAPINLGVPFAPGKKRHKQGPTKRAKVHKASQLRLRRLKKVGWHMLKKGRLHSIVLTTVRPATEYGAKVNGATN